MNIKKIVMIAFIIVALKSLHHFFTKTFCGQGPVVSPAMCCLLEQQQTTLNAVYPLTSEKPVANQTFPLTFQESPGVPHQVEIAQLNAAQQANYQLSVQQARYQQQIAVQEIVAKISNFYTVASLSSGAVQPSKWNNFTRGLVTEYPNMLIYTCRKQSSYGKLLLYFKNPNYMSDTGSDQYCYLYLRPTISVPITIPTYTPAAAAYTTGAAHLPTPLP